MQDTVQGRAGLNETSESEGRNPVFNPQIPPQNLEAEESVLGAMLISDRAVSTVSELLVSSDFYRPRNGTIYAAMLELERSGHPVDAIVLSDFLEERGKLEEIGGQARLAELAALVPAAGNVEHYARIVRDSAMLRKIIDAGQSIVTMGFEHDGTTPEIMERAEQLLFDISQRRVSSDFSDFTDLLKDNFELVTRLQETGNTIIGAPSGFPELDKMTTGFHPGNLIIVASRPSMGKSALALGIASHLGLQDIPVALFTLEMSEQEVTQRLVSMESKVDSQRLRTGQLTQDDWERFTEASGRLAKIPLSIDDSGGITIMEMRAKARRLKAKQPKLGLMIVDYVQLMIPEGKAENRVQEVSQISRGLKVLARDLRIPIIAMSQLNRNLETRHDKRPLLSDLRESGALEQDADLVIFIYRDDYYNKEESEHQGVAEIIVGKQRNGPIGVVRLSFLRRYAKFANLAAQ